MLNLDGHSLLADGSFCSLSSNVNPVAMAEPANITRQPRQAFFFVQ
jgi:hypothetical protein